MQWQRQWKIRTISRRRSRSPVRRNCSFHVTGTLRKTRRLRQPERRQIKTWWAEPWISTIIKHLCIFRSRPLLIKNVKWPITRLFGRCEGWKESQHIQQGPMFSIIGRHWLDVQSRPKVVETPSPLINSGKYRVFPTKRVESPDYQHCKWGEGRTCLVSLGFGRDCR